MLGKVERAANITVVDVRHEVEAIASGKAVSVAGQRFDIPCYC